MTRLCCLARRVVEMRGKGLRAQAFLVYFCKTVGIVPPTAWSFSEFIGANVGK